MKIDEKQLKLRNMAGMRNSFGVFLTQIAGENPDICAVSADFTKSSGLDGFAKTFPERFLSSGIAEQNTVSLASGIASEGKNVFVTSFASFLTSRCYEQIRINLGYMRHNVKLVGIAAGFGVSFQGNTHYGLDDVALMRLIPNMTVIVPSDIQELANTVEQLSDFEGPAYLRIVGEGFVPVVNPPDYDFKTGKGIKLIDGSDVLIIANGTMVSQALKAAKELSNVCVINMHTVKPLDTEIIKENINGKKIVVTIEEGFINGGLGSAVAEFVSEQNFRTKVIRLGVSDFFPKPGSYPYLLQQSGLTAEQIVQTIKNEL
jgi:transketolase